METRMGKTEYCEMTMQPKGNSAIYCEMTMQPKGNSACLTYANRSF